MAKVFEAKPDAEGQACLLVPTKSVVPLNLTCVALEIGFCIGIGESNRLVNQKPTTNGKVPKEPIHAGLFVADGPTGIYGVSNDLSVVLLSQSSGGVVGVYQMLRAFSVPITPVNFKVKSV